MRPYPLEKLEQLRLGFIERGESIVDFCNARNLDYNATLNVLYGRAMGKRGKAHDAAVALGLKPPVAATGCEIVE
jgi:gp16 family phage-associated protein